VGGIGIGRCSGLGRAWPGSGARWRLGVDGTRDPRIVVVLDAEGRAKGVMKQGVLVIKEAEVDGVEGLGWA